MPNYILPITGGRKILCHEFPGSQEVSQGSNLAPKLGFIASTVRRRIDDTDRLPEPGTKRLYFLVSPEWNNAGDQRGSGGCAVWSSNRRVRRV